MEGCCETDFADFLGVYLEMELEGRGLRQESERRTPRRAALAAAWALGCAFVGLGLEPFKKSISATLSRYTLQSSNFNVCQCCGCRVIAFNTKPSQQEL